MTTLLTGISIVVLFLPRSHRVWPVYVEHVEGGEVRGVHLPGGVPPHGGHRHRLVIQRRAGQDQQVSMSTRQHVTSH